MKAEATHRWIAVARLLRPQGRRGELLSELLTDLPDVFHAGQTAWLVDSEAAEPAPEQAPAVLEALWMPSGRNAGRAVLKLAGCDSISQAEQLAGKFVVLPAHELPALEADTFFVADLLGCRLFNGAEEVGRIVDLQFPIAADGRTRLPDAAPLLALELSRARADEASSDEASSDTSDPSAPVPGSQPDLAAAEPVLIPFVRAWLESVDIAHKRIVMHLPEGLLE